MEPLTFPCPSCGRLLCYEFEQAGDPFECPGCGTRATLPGIQLQPLDEGPRPEEPEDLGPAAVPLQANAPPPPPRAAEEQMLQEEADRRARKREQRRLWRPVVRGLTVLLFCWLAVTVLATILLLGMVYHILRILFPLTGESLSKEAVGVLGILFFLAESVALVGYRLLQNAPKEEGIHDWAWVSFGLAAVRNVACLGTSIAYLTVDLESRTALGVFTIVAAGLFFGHWFINTLLLRAVAYALKSAWLVRMAWNNIFLLTVVVLGWTFTLCLLVTYGGEHGEGFEQVGMLEGAWMRIFVSCGGAVLGFGLWLAVVWHLRLLNYLRGSIEV
jgi:hypothetical protein